LRSFCTFADRYDDTKILPNFCGLDFVTYAARRRGAAHA
jgi:hypothetical protein